MDAKPKRLLEQDEELELVEKHINFTAMVLHLIAIEGFTEITAINPKTKEARPILFEPSSREL